jgi:hypothetical protein
VRRPGSGRRGGGPLPRGARRARALRLPHRAPGARERDRLLPRPRARRRGRALRGARAELLPSSTAPIA